MRGRRLWLNHTVQCGGSNQFSMMDGSPPLTTTPSPALAEAAARSNPHRRTPPSRSPRVPSSEAFGRRPHDRWIDHDGPASETLHGGGHRRSSVRFWLHPSTRTKDPTMTDEMMSLQALLEKSSDTDLLREMIGFAAHRLMELEVENLTGAA